MFQYHDYPPSFAILTFVIRAEGLGKQFDGRWVFRNLDLAVEPGMCLVVLGRNGAGKSTLLRCLAGLTSPTLGRIAWPKGDRRLTIGYSSLDIALYSQLDATEQLDFAGKMRGCLPRPTELLNQVGILSEDHTVKPLRQFSTGMRARVKLAIALQANPQVLLLDEPGASLDAQGRDLIQSVIESQLKGGCVIMATNDPAERRFATHELELVG